MSLRFSRETTNWTASHAMSHTTTTLSTIQTERTQPRLDQRLATMTFKAPPNPRCQGALKIFLVKDLVNLGLGLVGTTVDRFARIKWWPMDQATYCFIDGFTGFVGGYRKSRSDRSEVEQPLMQQQADPIVGAAVEVVCYRWPAAVVLIWDAIFAAAADDTTQMIPAGSLIYPESEI
ncbi:hypothetical protein WN943_000048 [Citrus x changshan-huyou]